MSNSSIVMFGLTRSYGCTRTSVDAIKKALEMGVKKFLIKGAFRPSNLKKEVYETLGFVDT